MKNPKNVEQIFRYFEEHEHKERTTLEDYLQVIEKVEQPAIKFVLELIRQVLPQEADAQARQIEGREAPWFELPALKIFQFEMPAALREVPSGSGRRSRG